MPDKIQIANRFVDVEEIFEQVNIVLQDQVYLNETPETLGDIAADITARLWTKFGDAPESEREERRVNLAYEQIGHAEDTRQPR